MSDSFDPTWLLLREPVDSVARSPELLQKAASYVDQAGDKVKSEIVDLGAGTGSALRALSPALKSKPSWRLIEKDPVLAEFGAEILNGQDIAFGYQQADLATASLSDLVGDARLVSASALLDLCSAAWIENFVEACTATGAAVWLTLNVDGRKQWSPSDHRDWVIERAFDRDMRRDKGLGPALGANAAAKAAEAFLRRGYAVSAAKADWRLGPHQTRLQRLYVDGYTNAAFAQRPDLADQIERWSAARFAAIEQGCSKIRVGHLDIFAAPKRDG